MKTWRNVRVDKMKVNGSVENNCVLKENLKSDLCNRMCRVKIKSHYVMT